METAKRAGKCARPKDNIDTGEGCLRPDGQFLVFFIYSFIEVTNFYVFHESQFIDVACVLVWGNVLFVSCWSAVRGALESRACAEGN